MSLYARVAELPLVIEDLAYELAAVDFSPSFTRRTTTVSLGGPSSGGTRHVGVGEDVTYDPDEHDAARRPRLDLAGSWTIDSLSKHLDQIDLFPAREPAQEAYRNYRRWAFEAAALDLALNQLGRPLQEIIGREPLAVRFVSSTRAVAIERWLELYPALRFKLDTTAEWTDEFVAGLAAGRNVEVVDLKGAYHGTSVDTPPDADLYARVATLLPDAWIEDPALTPETDAALAEARDRITWDAPIHSWSDVENLPFPPRCLNCKPSRFGSVERLFEFYDRCAKSGIALYGGGQFELGVGRGQIQLLAALFHSDGPNDVAPAGYNASAPLAGPPAQPARPSAFPHGLSPRRGIARNGVSGRRRASPTRTARRSGR